MALPTTIGQARNGNLIAMKREIMKIDPSVASATELVNQASLMALYGRIQDSLFIDLGDPTSLGDISSGDLSSFLSNADSLADFNARLSDQTWCNLLTGSKGAMTTVAGSVTAVTALTAAPKGVTAALASQIAMTELMASNVAVSVFVASAATMTALVASQVASAAMAASPTMMNAVSVSASCRASIGNGTGTQTKGFAAISLSSMAIAKYSVSASGLYTGVGDPTLYNTMADVTALSNSQMAQLLSTSTGPAIVWSFSMVAMAALVNGNGFITAVAGNTVESSVTNSSVSYLTAAQFYVGAMLDKIRTGTGSIAASNANLLACNTAAQVASLLQADIAAIVSHSNAFRTMLMSAAIMNVAVTKSPAIAAICATATNMTNVWAYNSSTFAMFSTTLARDYMYTNDVVCLATLQASYQAVQSLITNNKVNKTVTTNPNTKFTALNVKTILLRRFYTISSNNEIDYIGYKKSGNGVDQNNTNGVADPSNTRSLYTGSMAQGSQINSYTANGVVPTGDDYTGNFVAAANGLERCTWAYGATMTCYFIAV